MRRLIVVNGHPDPRPARFCAALAAAYVQGGAAGGWRADAVNVGELSLSSLRGLGEGDQPDALAAAMLTAIEEAERLAIIYPLWFDKPPEPLTTLFSRVVPRKAHVIVTMDMPAFAYRSIVRGPERSPVLDVPNIVPDEPVLIGCAGAIPPDQRQSWLETVHRYGERTTHGSSASPSRVAAWIDRTVAEFWA